MCGCSKVEEEAGGRCSVKRSEEVRCGIRMYRRGEDRIIRMGIFND
tara:strand:- start:449 stop:586 length:138 start_codon:yes stop_codon:yes gene_type:complete